MAKSLLDAVGLSCTASNATLAIIRGGKYYAFGRKKTRGFSMVKFMLLFSFSNKAKKFSLHGSLFAGHKQSLDVATISQGQSRFFSVLMLAWGITSSILFCGFSDTALSFVL